MRWRIGILKEHGLGLKEIKETTLLIEVDGNVTLRIDKNMVVADNSDLQRQ